MDQKSIDRINELARKAKTVGLTPERKRRTEKTQNRIYCCDPYEPPGAAGQYRYPGKGRQHHKFRR